MDTSTVSISGELAGRGRVREPAGGGEYVLTTEVTGDTPGGDRGHA